MVVTRINAKQSLSAWLIWVQELLTWNAGSVTVFFLVKRLNNAVALFRIMSCWTAARFLFAKCFAVIVPMKIRLHGMWDLHMCQLCVRLPTKFLWSLYNLPYRVIYHGYIPFITPNRTSNSPSQESVSGWGGPDCGYALIGSIAKHSPLQSCRDAYGDQDQVIRNSQKWFKAKSIEIQWWLIYRKINPDYSQKWFETKSTGNLYSLMAKTGFPWDFPINEPSELYNGA